MPEANVLYGVTSVVVLGLVAWVGFVLKTAKEPWARTLPQIETAGLRAEDPPLESPEENDMTSEGDPITAEKVEETKEHIAEASASKKDDKKADDAEEEKKSDDA